MRRLMILLVTVCACFTAAPASFDADTNLWDPLITSASKAIRHAQGVLDAE